MTRLGRRLSNQAAYNCRMHHEHRHFTRRAVVRHVVLSLVVAAMVCGLLVLGVLTAAHREAEDHARRIAEQVASAVAVPLSRHHFATLGQSVPDDVRRDLAPFLDSGMVSRVKVWLLRDGRATIVYSDEQRLVGEGHDLGTAGFHELDPGEVYIQPVPDDHEHRFEASSAGMLLEAFVEIQEAGGEPARLELYVPTDVRGETERLASAILPLLLGGLLLLALTTLPLSVRLARWLEQERAEQRAVRRYGLASAESTRLELARHLHNGVIPHLAGATLLLEMARAGKTEMSPSELVDRAHQLLESDVRELRAILDGLVIADAGGVPGLEDLAERLREEADGSPPVTVTISVAEAPRCEIGMLLHWVAEELVRNALRHARADQVRVDLVISAELGARLTVSDDGVGLPVAPGRGGTGLYLARRVVEDHGGRLLVSTRVPGGTTVEVSLPPAEGSPSRPVDSFAELTARLFGRRFRRDAGPGVRRAAPTRPVPHDADDAARAVLESR